MVLDHAGALTRPGIATGARHDTTAVPEAGSASRSAENQARIVAHLRTILLSCDRSQVWG
jgi:hypothetical protein